MPSRWPKATNLLQRMSILQESGHQIQKVHRVDTVPRPCYRCGQSGHCQEHCKFKSSTCHYCGKRGHIKIICRSQKSSSDSSSSIATHAAWNQSNHRHRHPSRQTDSSPLQSEPSLSHPCHSSYIRPRSFRSSQPSRSSEIKHLSGEEPTESEE